MATAASMFAIVVLATPTTLRREEARRDKKRREGRSREGEGTRREGEGEEKIVLDYFWEEKRSEEKGGKI
jgi:hypothetical protein